MTARRSTHAVGAPAFRRNGSGLRGKRGDCLPPSQSRRRVEEPAHYPRRRRCQPHSIPRRLQDAPLAPDALHQPGEPISSALRTQIFPPQEHVARTARSCWRRDLPDFAYGSTPPARNASQSTPPGGRGSRPRRRSPAEQGRAHQRQRYGPVVVPTRRQCVAPSATAMTMSGVTGDRRTGRAPPRTARRRRSLRSRCRASAAAHIATTPCRLGVASGLRVKTRLGSAPRSVCSASRRRPHPGPDGAVDAQVRSRRRRTGLVELADLDDPPVLDPHAQAGRVVECLTIACTLAAEQGHGGSDRW